MSIKLGKGFLLLILLLPVSAVAGSIGDAAENLLGPTSLVTKLVEVGCYIIGLAFIMMALAQYKIHRQSPKLVPLATPITLVILGVIALLIPYSTHLTQTGKADIKREASQAMPLPVPAERSKGATLPYPPNYQQQQEQQQQQETPATNPQQYEAPATPPSETGTQGGWTTDPRYRQ